MTTPGAIGHSDGMKKTLLALGLATGLAVPLFAGETLH